jgi:hypothetical protein
MLSTLSRRHLCQGDVAFGQADVTFTFRHSKTNQFHARVHRTKAVRIACHPLDPIQSLVNAFKVCPHAAPAGPTFAVPTRDGEVAPLTHRHFVETLRSCLPKIGVNPSKFSEHSFDSTWWCNFCPPHGRPTTPHYTHGRLKLRCVHDVHRPHHPARRTWPACLGLSPRPSQPWREPSPSGERATQVGRLPDLSVVPDVVTVHLNRLTHAFQHVSASLTHALQHDSATSVSGLPSSGGGDVRELTPFYRNLGY